MIFSILYHLLTREIVYYTRLSAGYFFLYLLSFLDVRVLDKYLRITIDEKFITPNSLPFWQHYEVHLPHLAKLAKRLYSIPATSCDVERDFSAAGVLVNERRSSLNRETVENVFCFALGAESINEKSKSFFQCNVHFFLVLDIYFCWFYLLIVSSLLYL